MCKVFPVVVYLLAEIEELTGRLKASRQRVADLERNFTSASNSSQKNEKVIHLMSGLVSGFLAVMLN